MEELPEEMKLEILSRVPSKSFARFRCVSKSWNLLEYGHEFPKYRFESAPQQPQMGAQKLLLSSASTLYSLNCETLIEKTELDFPFKKPGIAVKIVGSCNGLVFVVPDGVKDFFLWNPSTGIYRKLPNPEIDGHYPCFYCFYHYPCLYRVRCGFGYDSVSGDYKIVLLTGPKIENAWKDMVGVLSVQVFSVKENAWKKLPNHTLAFGVLAWSKRKMGLLYNGAVHWIVGYKDGKTIYAFDLATENFYEVPLPVQNQDDFDSFQDLGVLRGFLCVILRAKFQNQYNLQVLVRKENQWVRVDEFQDFDPAKFMQILCVNGRGAHILQVNFRSLAIYSPQESENAYSLDVCGGEAFETIPYIENLNSPYAPSPML